MRSQRLQRFFRNFDLDYAVVAKTVIALMGIPQPWVLSTDRTIAVGNPPANKVRSRATLWEGVCALKLPNPRSGLPHVRARTTVRAFGKATKVDRLFSL